MAKRINDRNTKAEILEAYQALLDEKKHLQAQVKQAQRSPDIKPATSANSSTSSTDSRSSETSDKLEHPKLQDYDTLAQLQQIQLGFGGFISQLSEVLTRDSSQFAEISSAIEAEQERLRNLYEIESVDETTLTTLVESYRNESKQFAEEFETEQEQLEQELQAQLEAWCKEQADWQHSFDEERQRLETIWKRENEEYHYQRAIAQEIDEERYQQQLQEQYRQLDESRQEQERAWQERETAIAEREAEWAELQAKVAAFPGQRDEQIHKGKRQGEAIATHQVNSALELRQQEIEGQQRRYELQIEGLERTIGDRQQQIQSLSQQLEATLQQVQELAVKAIEGHANGESLQAVKEIALEQAKTAGRTK
ncbi:MAG: hypothetical protein ACLFM4_06755 [Phormidium sp.]|nr:MAG: Baculovirus polyhedron envelope protein, PEP, C terminus [Phormidium sp. OSCR]